MTTHLKLGLLALFAIAASLTTAVALGVRSMRAATVEYHTYFDESVQGLELGSPVKYRGVRIGRVAQIAIAPDRKHVDVLLALGTGQAQQLGIADTAPELRAQLATQGVTGVKFIDLDFFDPKANPPPALEFPIDARHIPARASLMKGLEDNLEAIAPRLPLLVDHIDTMVAKTSRLTDELTDQLNEQQLGRRLAHATDEAAGAAAAVRQLVRRLDGLDALVASARRATDSLGDLGHATVGSGDALERTLRQLGDAARSVRELSDSIRRDPDSLLKGRARSGQR